MGFFLWLLLTPEMHEPRQIQLDSNVRKIEGIKASI
jgi:hypothetical protein